MDTPLLITWLMVCIIIFGLGVLLFNHNVIVGSIVMSAGAFFIVLLSTELLIKVNS